ncbi:MAG: TolC family protein [Spirochaetaceae bacterium]|jgi:multidrug efflux system outer membrane protein|nr:TolC family protein [Spirochaetaceae bacterium]
MVKRIFFSCLFLLAARLWSQTQEGELHVTLEDGLRRALQTDVALQRKAVDAETARVSVANLWSEFFPTVSVGASLSYGDTPSDPKKTFPHDTEYRVPLDITLNLSSVLPIPLNIQISKLAYETRLQDWRTEQQTVTIRVSQNFYRLLVDEENLALLEETLAIAERQLSKDEAQFRSGLANELTVMRSRLSAENARYALNKAQRDRQQNMSAFLSGAGFTDEEISGKQIFLDGTIEIEPLRLDADRLIEEYLPKRPDMINAVAEIRRLELTASRTSLTQRGPTLSVSGTYHGDLAGGTFNGTSQPFSDRLSAGLSVSIPLDSWIPGTKGAQAVMSAKAEVEKARLSLQSIRQSAANSIRSIVENMESTLSSIEVAQLRAEIAERTYRMSEAAFERGAMEILDYENARASWAQSRQDLLKERLTYKNLVLDLERELNVSIANGELNELLTINNE